MPAVEIVYRYFTALPANARPFPPDQAAARARLEAGNEAFAQLLSALEAPGPAPRRLEIPLDARDVGLLPEGTDDSVPRQRPYAAVLGCADARVPTELLFGEGPNDLFVVRVAGNVLGQEVLGSLRYAALNLPLRAVVVLGHSGCGAVSAAVDTFSTPSRILALATDHQQRGLLSHLIMTVQAASRVLLVVHGEAAASEPGWRQALIEMTVALNAALGAYTIRRDLASLSEAGASIDCLHGVYLIGSRRVTAADAQSGERLGLAPAPSSHEGFVADFGALAASPRIRALLAEAPSPQAG